MTRVHTRPQQKVQQAPIPSGVWSSWIFSATPRKHHSIMSTTQRDVNRTTKDHTTDEEHHKHTSVNHEEPIAISAQRETRRTRRERIPESIPVKRCFRRNFLTRLFSGRSVGSSVVRLPYSSRRHTTYSTLSGTSSTVWFNYGTSSYCLLTSAAAAIVCWLWDTALNPRGSWRAYGGLVNSCRTNLIPWIIVNVHISDRS